ncbi:putative glycolipid-binding domain-containing protein [Chryseobacterium sp. Alg-005]|uniref:putative glycolipid-binding domain-containing protein n=1 Tax=Chryseobacterium sp. Alg-005 TaxID=3159516 RepID=UPI003555B74C
MKPIIWKGILYHSLEYFNLIESEENYRATSRIIGSFENTIYFVSYQIVIDKNWLIQNFTIEYEVNGVQSKVTGLKNGNDWKINGTDRPEFSNFKYIDISLTPFTNTLPINNLNLSKGQSCEIDVIYIHILEDKIKPVKQQYTKISKSEYLYENIPKNFEARISVDDSGLVENYPGLFEKVLL